jgi:hypothetical protein
MKHSRFHRITAVGAASAAIIAATLVAAPAHAATSDPLTVVQAQGLLGTAASAPQEASRTNVALETANPVRVAPLNAGAEVADAATGTTVYSGNDYGTVTGLGNDGTNASFIVINNDSAPESYQFAIGDTDSVLTPAFGGRVQVKNAAGEVVNFLQAPWAHDASGKQLPT